MQDVRYVTPKGMTTHRLQTAALEGAKAITSVMILQREFCVLRHQGGSIV